MKTPALRLDELQIDGFGHFHEFKVELGPGLNVLYGDNEAGKSTLMAFVRSVLFGFARRNTPERYEPLGGKAFGGRVLMTTAHGELWVQRLGGKGALGDLTVKNGVMAPVPESRLREALASVDRALFEQVFAFGLDELRSWSQLMDAGRVNEALAAASMQGALRLPHALKKLEPDANELWGERASKRELNLALQAVTAVRARRQQLGDRPGQYFAARAALEQTQAEQTRLQQALETASREEFLLERLRDASPHVARAVQAAAELAALPEIAAFPPDGLVRLDEALAASETAQAALARANAAAAGLEHRLAQLNAQLAGRPATATIASALEGWRAVAPAFGELAGRRADCEQRQLRLSEAVQRLGLSTPLESVDASASARASLTGMRTRLAEAAEARGRALEAARLAAVRGDDVQRELGEREAELSGLGADAGSESFGQALEAARSLGNLEHQARVVQAQLEDRQTALAAAAVPDEPAPVEHWPLALVASVGLGLLALAGVTAALAGFGPGVAAVGFAVVFNALLIGLYQRGHRHWLEQKSAHQAVLRHRHEHRERLGVELTLAQSRFATLRQQLEQTRTVAGVAAEAPSGTRLAQLERLAGHAGRSAELLRDVALGRARKLAAAGEADAAGERLAEAETRWEQVRQPLDAALEELGLPAGLEGSSALELLSEIALAQNSARALADLRACLDRDAARVRLAVEALSSAAGLVRVLGNSPAEMSACLAAWLKATAALETDAATLASRLEDGAATVARERAAQAHAQSRIDALLGTAGVADVEQFRRAGAAFEAATLARGELRQAAAGVQAASGLEVEAAHAQLLLAPGVESRLESARGRRVEIEAARRAVHEQRGSLAQQLTAWESDAELGRLLQDEQALVAKAEQLARRVAVARLGQAVLGHAREKFEAEHQPQLVLRAAETFQHLTDGRYPRLALDAASGALHAIDRQGHAITPEQLSRGTREQLLTALRLAMIEDFGRERLALPVLVDDVLVNFDPKRAARMVDALAELAKRHQVLAFTCHPQVRELFKAHGAKAIEVSTRAQLALLPS